MSFFKRKYFGLFVSCAVALLAFGGWYVYPMTTFGGTYYHVETSTTYRFSEGRFYENGKDLGSYTVFLRAVTIDLDRAIPNEHFDAKIGWDTLEMPLPKYGRSKLVRDAPFQKVTEYVIKTKADCRDALKRIEDELMVVIPRAIRRCKTKDPMYGLLVCYLDLTPADEEYTPHLHLLPKSHRDQCVEDGEVGYIWVLPEIETFGPITAPKSAPVNKLCNAVYHFLTDGRPDQNEFELIMPFRKMIYRVCRRLNSYDWSKELNVTDDFTVVASDWSTGAFIEDDANASVPAAQQRKLAKNGFFFNP